MKSVLISIQPKWCELIASGKKTVEVRKTRPKLETPFKVYIYCTKPPRGLPNIWNAFGIGGYCLEHSSKVIGEFVCDQIDEIGFSPVMHGKYISDIDDIHYVSCLNFEQMFDYLGDGFGYGWHISDLVIYDKPRELSEFYQKGKNNDQYYYDYCSGCEHHETPIGEYPCNECDGNRNYLYRPPQSWCYVESEEQK